MNARLKNAVAAELSTRKPAKSRKPAEEIAIVANRLVTRDGVLLGEVRYAAILLAPPSTGRNRVRPFAREELRAPSRVVEFAFPSGHYSKSATIGIFAGENFEERTSGTLIDGRLSLVTLGTLVRTYVEVDLGYSTIDPHDRHATPPGTKVAVSWIGEVLDVKA